MYYFNDAIENICIENGIYNYLYIEEFKKSINEWCENKCITTENIGIKKGKFPFLQGLINTSEIGSVRELLINRNKKAEIKYLLLKIDRNRRIKSLIQNMFYIVFYRCLHILSFRKLINGLQVEYGGGRMDFELSCNIIDIIMIDKASYESAINTVKESFYMKRLIADYLYIKDFKNAIYYAHIFALKGFDENHEMAQLITQIQNELLQIKINADKKRSEHIVWNWIDGLQYNHLENMPYLHKKIHEGIYYTNMCNVAPYTNAAMHTVMSGKLLIDDCLWKLEKKDIKNEMLLKYLKNKGYSFIYIGEKYQNNCFVDESDNDTIAELPLLKGFRFLPSTVFQYELIRLMATVNNRTVFLVHNLYETHEPFLNAEEVIIDKKKCRDVVNMFGSFPDTYIYQISRSQKWLDEELEFYHRYYSDSVKYEILFSDHGPGMFRDIFASEAHFHMIFGITGRSIYPREINTIQSLTCFPDIMMNLIESKISSIGTEYCKDYAPIQRDDTYSAGEKNFIKFIKSYGYKCNWLKIKCFQFRGVKTQEDCYVRWACGKEYYERNGNSENLIYEPEYQERIDYLKRLNGNIFINPFKEDKYKDIRILYKKLGLCLAKGNNYLN